MLCVYTAIVSVVLFPRIRSFHPGQLLHSNIPQNSRASIDRKLPVDICRKTRGLSYDALQHAQSNYSLQPRSTETTRYTTLCHIQSSNAECNALWLQMKYKRLLHSTKYTDFQVGRNYPRKFHSSNDGLLRMSMRRDIWPEERRIAHPTTGHRTIVTLVPHSHVLPIYSFSAGGLWTKPGPSYPSLLTPWMGLIRSCCYKRLAPFQQHTA